MKLIYKGKFKLDPESLPHGEHKAGAVKFKEPETPKKLALIANALALVLTGVALFGVYARLGFRTEFNIWGVFVSLLCLFPHEILHAVCFKEEVYLYTNFKQGMLFVTGPETMSKTRFVIMSLLPNIVFGFIPYIIFMCFPSLTFFGSFGAMSIGMGASDYYNVFNALTQMPKGARTYIYGFSSYWYKENR
ncbi:MAG: DUF3267 domain-containing protein [Oscillospiraceae bacterium]|nr:DUF3267 domain-containing protein [Oscillospiraceae bacterium]